MWLGILAEGKQARGEWTVEDVQCGNFCFSVFCDMLHNFLYAFTLSIIVTARDALSEWAKESG